jgi:DNA ligase-1
VDGELLPYKEGEIGNFNALQKRIGRKIVSQKLQNEVPIVIMLYDLLELEGKDIRWLPLAQRQELLAALYKKTKGEGVPLLLSKVVRFSTWEKVAQERERAQEMRSEGLMLKHKKSPYAVGRKKGTWWKWKSDPNTIDAIFIQITPLLSGKTKN